MVGIVIQLEDLARLSEETRAELLRLFGEAEPRAAAAAAPPPRRDPEADVPYPLSVREAKELVRGLSESSRGVLRLFCRRFDGRVGRADLRALLAETGHADSQRLRKAISGITRRLRTVTGDKQAWLLDWNDEDWRWDPQRRVYTEGEYFIPRPAIVSLCQAFGLEEEPHGNRTGERTS